MATPYSGKSGALVTYNAITAADMNLTSWSISITDSAPSSAHSNSSGWVDSFAGVKAWSASIDVLIGATATDLPAAGDAITTFVVTDGTHTYTGEGGQCSGASYACDIAGGGLMAVSASISGTGTLTIT